MGYMVFKGEKKIHELVSRAYGELKPADARRAEAALKAANPHLSKLQALPEGAILVVPAVPGIEHADAAGDADPLRGGLATLAHSLERYCAHLQSAARAEVDGVKAESLLRKSAGIDAAARESPEIAPYVRQATAAWGERSKQAEETAALVKRILPEARQALATMAKLLARG